MNIRFDYLYRDGSNYKRHGSVVFGNPRGLSEWQAVGDILAATSAWRILGDVCHFRPERVGIPTCYFTDVGYPQNEDDFDLHELNGLEATEEAVTDSRTIDEFIVELARIGKTHPPR